MTSLRACYSASCSDMRYIVIEKFDSVGMAKGNTGYENFCFFQFNYQFLVLFRTKCAGVVFKEGFCGFGRRMVNRIIATTFLRKGFSMLVTCWSESKLLCLDGDLKSRKKPAGLFGLSRLSTQGNHPKQKACLFPQRNNCTVEARVQPLLGGSQSQK